MPHPVHFEIHATDPDKLSKFYADVFGWKVQHLPHMNYWLLDTGGTNGGMMKRHGAAAPDGAAVNAFVMSLGVASVDEMLKKSLAAGATVALPKQAIPGVGWQVYIKDLDGNILGLHQPDASAK